MKNGYYLILIAIHICISTSLFTMNNQQERSISTVAVFDKDTAATGSSQHCALVTNFQKSEKDQVVKILHPYPTHNIIANKTNHQLGVFSQFGFIVYDIKTGNRIWSKMVDSDNCSAAFSPIDKTIFLCDNGYLSTNENISMNLPYTRNRYFNIECHPKKKELLYPYSNTTLATYSFASKTYRQHSPSLEQTDIITRALYSPEGNYIALLTNKQNILIYNLKDNSTVWARGTFGYYYGCINPIFIPCSHILFFLTNNGRSGHYFDVEKMHSLAEHEGSQAILHYFDPEKDRSLTNKIDFSLDGSYLLTATKTQTARGYCDIPHAVTNTLNQLKHQKLFSYYCLLKLYSDENERFLVHDVIKSLIQQLRILFNFTKN